MARAWAPAVAVLAPARFCSANGMTCGAVWSAVVGFQGLFPIESMSCCSGSACRQTVRALAILLGMPMTESLVDVSFKEPWLEFGESLNCWVHVLHCFPKLRVVLFFPVAICGSSLCCHCSGVDRVPCEKVHCVADTPWHGWALACKVHVIVVL